MGGVGWGGVCESKGVGEGEEDGRALLGPRPLLLLPKTLCPNSLRSLRPLPALRGPTAPFPAAPLPQMFAYQVLLQRCAEAGLGNLAYSKTMEMKASVASQGNMPGRFR